MLVNNEEKIIQLDDNEKILFTMFIDEKDGQIKIASNIDDTVICELMKAYLDTNSNK